MPVSIPGRSIRPPDTAPSSNSKKKQKESKAKKLKPQEEKIESLSSHRVTCLIISPFDTAGIRIKDTLERAMDEIGIAV